MDNKGHIVLSCDTLGTTVPEARQNLQMSSPTLTMDNIENVDEQESLNYPNNCEDSSERLQSSEYVNYYDNESYVLEHLKTEFPEDILPQSDCSVNSKIHCENKELLKFDAKAEINDENTEDGLLLNIKKENDCNEYRFIVKTEGLEEQEDVQSEFCDKTLNNGCNLLQNGNKHMKVEINTPVDNGITELHQCQYCGKGFDNYNTMLVHISNDHKQEKSKCNICGKQFKTVGNLSRHIRALHKLDKPLEPITESCVNCHVNVQHSCPLNDHSKLSCSGKGDESENKVTRNITNYDYGAMFECRCGKQFRSRIYLREHQKLTHRPKIPKTNNKRFQCDYCKKIFQIKRSVATHIQSVHFDYGRQFECWCGKLFRSPIHLRHHDRHMHQRNVKNTKKDKFQCDYCKGITKTKSYLLVHIMRQHYDYGKRFDCWCGKQFRSPIDLRGHEKRIHNCNVENINNSKFQCDYCKNYFKTKSYLFAHIKRLHYDYGKRFGCWCGKHFRSPLHLYRHERLVHKREKRNRIYCNLLQNSNKHVKVEINTPVDNGITELHRCQYCGKGFGNYNNVLVHISNEHKQDKSKCDICEKQFKSVGNLNRHILAFHQLDKLNEHPKLPRSGKEDGEDESGNKVTKNITTYDYGPILECSYKKPVRSRIHLREHQKLRHRPKIPKTNNGTFQCDSCKNFYKTKHILITHIERVHYDYGKRFECRCGKQFRTPFHLRQHEKNVHRDTLQNTNDGKFQCDYCKFFFKTKMYLLGHIKRLHRDYGKRFDCWCGKQFRSPMNLYEHERLLHVRNNTNSNYGKFQCDYCKVFLSTKSNILIHIKRLHHDYGKRFDCWCGKQFRSPLDLRGHEKRIHNRNVQNTNNGKFQCDYCKYFFKTKIILFGHIKRLHYDYGKRFDCWCGKQFRSPIHLREHERIMQHRKVNNNGKFQCDYCKIFLKTKANVLTHIKRLHYDYGKQFDCWCGKQFRSPMHLYDHKRKTHQRDDKEK